MPTGFVYQSVMPIDCKHKLHIFENVVVNILQATRSDASVEGIRKRMDSPILSMGACGQPSNT